jgi:hypothetical protein
MKTKGMTPKEHILLSCILEEVLTTYTANEVKHISFTEFWNMVDQTNGHEPIWERKKGKLKPLYAEAFHLVTTFIS